MGNKLRVDLEMGQVVIMADNVPAEIAGGFGMKASSMGNALYAKMADGTSEDIRFCVERVATDEEAAAFKASVVPETRKRLAANVEAAKEVLAKAEKAFVDYYLTETSAGPNESAKQSA